LLTNNSKTSFEFARFKHVKKTTSSRN